MLLRAWMSLFRKRLSRTCATARRLVCRRSGSHTLRGDHAARLTISAASVIVSATSASSPIHCGSPPCSTSSYQRAASTAANFSRTAARAARRSLPPAAHCPITEPMPRTPRTDTASGIRAGRSSGTGRSYYCLSGWTGSSSSPHSVRCTPHLGRPETADARGDPPGSDTGSGRSRPGVSPGRVVEVPDVGETTNIGQESAVAPTWLGSMWCQAGELGPGAVAMSPAFRSAPQAPQVKWGWTGPPQSRCRSRRGGPAGSG